MHNVTDSLNFLLDYLPELEHEMDVASKLAVAAMGHDAQSCEAAVTALGTVGGHLRYAIERLQREHRSLVEAGSLFRTGICTYCGSPFVESSHSRSPKQFCSQACRQAAYRNRRRAPHPQASLDER
jgi:hypothetical protein